MLCSISVFVSRFTGQHNIDVKWNGVPIVQSPVIGYATRDPDTGVFPNNVPPVYLAGHRPRCVKQHILDTNVQRSFFSIELQFGTRGLFNVLNV